MITKIPAKEITFLNNFCILNFDESLDFIIDAAAKPSVLAGLDETPDYLIHTNLNGTIHLLNLAKKHNAGFLFLGCNR